MTELTFTHWRNKTGTACQELVKPWPDFCQWLSDYPRQKTKHGKLVKLATFGDKTSDRGSLRIDANVLAVTGIEGDYDAESVAPEQAIEALEKVGLKALVVPTFTSTPNAPRWRVFTPLSKPVKPDERLKYAEYLNAILDGILASESATLSQSYYVGVHPDADYQVLMTFDDPEEGLTLDELEAQGAIYERRGFNSKTEKGTENPKKADGKTVKDGFDDWVTELCSGGAVHPSALRIVGSMVAKRQPDEVIRATFIGLADRVEAERGKERANTLRGKELDDLISSARKKFLEGGYETLLAEARSFDPDTPPAAIESLAKRAAKLTPLEEEGILNAIKSQTKATLTQLRGVARTVKKQATRERLEAREIAPSIKPMPLELFPDVLMDSESGDCRLLNTLPNCEAMLDHYGIKVAYDVIRKRTSLHVPDLKTSVDNAENTAMTHVISLASLNQLGADKIPAYVQAVADRRQVNTVAEWVFSQEWDGEDRLQALCDTLEVELGYPAHLRDVLIRKWLISAIAACCMPSGFYSRGVLTLQGPQSIGKTSWLDSLVPDKTLREQVVLTDWQYDAASKDSVLQAVSHWLVEIGELDGCFRKSDIARIKGFVTRRTDKLRRPYDRSDSEYPRRTVFFASVNDRQFLVDDTGNTRWWTIPVTRVNFRHGIDMQQLWAQVAEQFSQGETWWLTADEEQNLEQSNKGYRQTTAVRELITGYLSQYENNLHGKPDRVSATDVLRRVGQDRPTNAQAREAGSVLRELLGEPTKTKGLSRWEVRQI